MNSLCKCGENVKDNIRDVEKDVYKIERNYFVRENIGKVTKQRGRVRVGET